MSLDEVFAAIMAPKPKEEPPEVYLGLNEFFTGLAAQKAADVLPKVCVVLAEPLYAVLDRIQAFSNRSNHLTDFAFGYTRPLNPKLEDGALVIEASLHAREYGRVTPTTARTENDESQSQRIVFRIYPDGTAQVTRTDTLAEPEMVKNVLDLIPIVSDWTEANLEAVVEASDNFQHSPYARKCSLA